MLSPAQVELVSVALVVVVIGDVGNGFGLRDLADSSKISLLGCWPCRNFSTMSGLPTYTESKFKKGGGML